MSRRLLPALSASLLLFLAAAAQAAPAPRLASCSWDRPGHNPFMGDVVAAVDRYGDIPADVRAKLRQRMAERRYDDLVTIRRDSIVGGHEYSPVIRDMHFGEGSVCAQTSRSGWTAEMRERGLVYCESGHCILVPTVCRNVSRISRLPPRQVAEAPPAGGGGAAPGGGGDGELLFDPPGAGRTPDSFVGLTAPPQNGLGEGMTPMAGPAAPWPHWGDAAPPAWVGGGPGGFDDPVFGGREPIGGLPAVVLPPKLPQLPPLGGGPGGGGGGGDGPLPVTPVPEPGTWALMLAGLVVVARVARGRRRGG